MTTWNGKFGRKNDDTEYGDRPIENTGRLVDQQLKLPTQFSL